MSEQDNVRNMPIGKDKARLQATVTITEKEIVEKLAKDDERTVSMFVGRIVRTWLKENGHVSK